jgi:hypothetical protein
LPKFLEKHPLHKFYGGENAFMLVEYLSCLKSAGFLMHVVLGPWDSIINSTPFTRQKISELFIARFGKWFGASLVSSIVFSEMGFNFARPLLVLLDRRPGRLYTFVAVKQELAK